MKYLIVVLLTPLLLFCNLIGAIYALVAVGCVNGYMKMMELMDKAQEK